MLTVLLNPKKLDQHLDPISIPFTNDFYLLENLTARLLSFDENGSYQLDLARSIEERTPNSYLIELKNSGFSNGEMISSYDVKSTFERALNGTSHSNLKEFIEEIKLINDHSLEIKLKKPFKSFYYYLSLPDLGILHKSQYTKKSLKAKDFISVSSGPYSYGASGEDFFLTKNLHYKLTTLDYPTRINLLNYFNKKSHDLLLSGNADMGKVSVDYFTKNQKSFLNSDNFKVIGSPSSSLTYIFQNPNYNSSMSEKQLQCVKRIIQSRITIPSDLQWMARKTLQYFPPESKAHLDDAEMNFMNKDSISIDDCPKEIILHSYTTLDKVTLSQIVEQLENIKEFKVTIKKDVSPEEYNEKLLKGSFEFFINVMSTDFRTPVEAINFEFFSQERVLNDDKDIVRKEFDSYQKSQSELEESKHLKNISKYIVESNKIIPLFHSAIPYVYNSSKVNFRSLNHLFVFNFWKMQSI